MYHFVNGWHHRQRGIRETFALAFLSFFLVKNKQIPTTIRRPTTFFRRFIPFVFVSSIITSATNFFSSPNFSYISGKYSCFKSFVRLFSLAHHYYSSNIPTIFDKKRLDLNFAHNKYTPLLITSCISEEIIRQKNSFYTNCLRDIGYSVFVETLGNDTTVITKRLKNWIEFELKKQARLYTKSNIYNITSSFVA